MVHIDRWKVILILFVSLMGFAYAAPNVAGQGARDWLQTNLPSWMPTKTINLGLDLRGGAHLLYEVKVEQVFEERASLMVSDLRRQLREKRIRYSRLGEVDKGIRITLKEANDASEVRSIIQRLDQNLIISTGTDGLTFTAVFNDTAIKDIRDQTLSQSIEVIRRRIDGSGTTEPVIQRQGENRVLIQVPGVEAGELEALLGKAAKLSFHLVTDPTSRSATGLNLPMAENPLQKITVNRRAMITGDMLAGAQPTFQDGQPAISFRLNAAGARRFCDVSRNNIGKPFAIVLDNEILSAPVIRDAICGGQGVISGNFSVAEANNLALLLRAGALPADMFKVEERTIGPSLGADSVEAGKIASLIGLALVIVFMMICYGLFGVFACVALMVNVALIFAVLSGLQATLTLPGIAGIVLTIGMAVDANVLIFERIKEESRLGRSAISAVDSGYSRAMSTIIDSNLTTLIAAIILFSFGTGPIKGFAVTLGIGILTSFFSAIMVTRLMVVIWLRKTRPSVIKV